MYPCIKAPTVLRSHHVIELKKEGKTRTRRSFLANEYPFSLETVQSGILRSRKNFAVKHEFNCETLEYHIMRVFQRLLVGIGEAPVPQSSMRAVDGF